MTSSEHKQRLLHDQNTNSNLLTPGLQNDLAMKETTRYPNLETISTGFRSNISTKTTHHDGRDNPIASNTSTEAYAEGSKSIEREKIKGCEPWEREGTRRRRRHETTPPSPATGTANPSEATRGESAARTGASRGRRGVKGL